MAKRNRRDEAISFLGEVLDHDSRDPRSEMDDTWLRGIRTIPDDPLLAFLHGDPEFEAIVEELKRRNEDGEQATAR
jgi:hypothetical protein